MEKIHLKGQSAIEFIILASFMLLVILGFFAVVSSNVLEAKDEGNRKTAEDIADFAYREIETAKSVNDGYVRVFEMPQTVNGINYSISIIGNRELVVNYLGNEHIRFLPSNVTGNLTIGLNQIKKLNGIVYINGTKGECNNNIDDDGDSLTDSADPGCYLNCNYIQPSNFVFSFHESYTCSCSAVAKCCPVLGIGNHYTLFDNGCGTGQCWSACLPFSILKLKNNLFNVMTFISDGNVALKGTLQQNSNPSPTADDEFIVNDRNGNAVAIVNLITGNMFIKGTLQQNQAALSPSPANNNFIAKDSSGNVISYIDEAGNFLLKGNLTQNGNP